VRGVALRSHILRPRRHVAGFAASLATLALLVASGAAPAKVPPRPTIVTVNDFYFDPDAVTIGAGRSVRWVWSAGNDYPHDVHLKRGPKGLKNRSSYSTRTTAVTDAHFQHAFPTPGTYKFICTVHPTQMKLAVTVRR
jgi:plastocyanin